MSFSGFMKKSTFEAMLQMEGMHAKEVAGKELRQRFRANALYKGALRNDDLAGNDDPACLWD